MEQQRRLGSWEKAPQEPPEGGVLVFESRSWTHVFVPPCELFPPAALAVSAGVGLVLWAHITEVSSFSSGS